MNYLSLLKKSNYRVFIQHSRYYPEVPSPLSRREADMENFLLSDCESRGGLTEVEVYKGDDLVGYGSSLCSVKDNYCRKYGRELALERALQSILVSTEVA